MYPDRCVLESLPLGACFLLAAAYEVGVNFVGETSRSASANFLLWLKGDSSAFAEGE